MVGSRDVGPVCCCQCPADSRRSVDLLHMTSPSNITDSGDGPLKWRLSALCTFWDSLRSRCGSDCLQQTVIWFTSTSLTQWNRSVWGIWEGWSETAIWVRTSQLPELFLFPPTCFQRPAHPKSSLGTSRVNKWHASDPNHNNTSLMEPFQLVSIYLCPRNSVPVLDRLIEISFTYSELYPF